MDSRAEFVTYKNPGGIPSPSCLMVEMTTRNPGFLTALTVESGSVTGFTCFGASLELNDNIDNMRLEDIGLTDKDFPEDDSI